MGFQSLIITLIFLSLSLSPLESQEIKSARLLDLVIRDYIFRSHKRNLKTGKLYKASLPHNLSGIDVDVIRFRCGSLRRYGANITEFQLRTGTRVHPCFERVILVRTNLGSNWSSLYNDNYELSGYQLISPILGLLAYNVSCSQNSRSVPELKIQAAENKPITIDFRKTKLQDAAGIIPLCASFDETGKVTMWDQTRPNVCAATTHGHFGLVVESPLMPMRRKASKAKIAMGSTIGAALGVFLLSLLVMAMFVKKKKEKERMEEMERRAYEEEALRVSMVGHVRAVTASGMRTMPTIEHFECRPHPLTRSNS